MTEDLEKRLNLSRVEWLEEFNIAKNNAEIYLMELRKVLWKYNQDKNDENIDFMDFYAENGAFHYTKRNIKTGEETY